MTLWDGLGGVPGACAPARDRRAWSDVTVVRANTGLCACPPDSNLHDARHRYATVRPVVNRRRAARGPAVATTHAAVPMIQSYSAAGRRGRP
jgi:hypothetical protein